MRGLILFSDSSESADLINLISHHGDFDSLEFSQLDPDADLPDPCPELLIGLLPRYPTDAVCNAKRVELMVARLEAWARRITSSCKVAVLIQFSGGKFGTSENCNHWECGSASSFAKSVHQEFPNTCIRILDFPASIPAETLAPIIIRELESPVPFLQASFSQTGIRHRSRVTRVAPSEYPSRGISWSKEDVVMFTGGGKGITAECALAFAKVTGVRCALVGRSSPQEDSAVAETLRRFRDANLTAKWFHCDVSNRNQVRDLCHRLQTEFGLVSGIVHGAGQNRPARISERDRMEVVAEIAPKVLGAIYLQEFVNQDHLKLVVSMTSIIGVIGMVGNAWYAFSNELLHAFTRQWGRSDVSTQSIAFSLWADVGMGANLGTAKQLESQGISAIPVEEGTRRFVEICLGNPGRSQVIVTARVRGLSPLEKLDDERTAGYRFVEQVVSYEPGIELLVGTKLHPKRDAYLLDHNFKGSLLFPTVFGLEAMAQVATVLLNRTDLKIVCIKGIELERPIAVDPQVGCEIEIRGLVGEASSFGEQIVDVSIRAEQTGFAKTHFKAQFVFGKYAIASRVELPLSSAPLPIDPITDLYGSILFQGERFQRMGDILELDAEHVVFRGIRKAESEWQPFFESENDLVLGDPYLRDLLLQAGQITIPTEECLPISIDCIELSSVDNSGNADLFVFAPKKIREDGGYRAEIYAADEDGTVLERLTGYRLQILGDRPDLPAVSDLLAPGKRDQAILEKQLATTVVGTLPGKPGFAYQSMLGVHASSQFERRIEQLPLIENACRRFLGLSKESVCPVGVAWEESGRPFFGSSTDLSMGLSIAHDDFGCLSVVGAGDQGCDLEPIVQRSREDWRVLLTAHRVPLIHELESMGSTLDEAGTRIWCSIEAFKKATGTSPLTIVLAEQTESMSRLRMSSQKGQYSLSYDVLTLRIRFTLGPPRIIAFVIPVVEDEKTEADVARQPGAVDLSSNAGGIPSHWHSVDVAHDGPFGQPVQQMRFVVSFQEASSVGRRVPAARYMSWMGRIRELVTSANVPSLVTMIQSGKWGLVTNWGELKIHNETSANDVVQMRFWTDTPENSSVVFTCEFQKLLPDGSLEVAAVARQKATWVRIVGHGKVEPEPFPSALAGFIKEMGPRTDQMISKSPGGRSPFSELEQIVTDDEGESMDSPLMLREEIIQTTFEESNLVGNIYFANYFHWQERLRDLFKYQVGSSLGLPNIEWVTMQCRIDYLREAMPMDRLAISMSLRKIGTYSMTFSFEYFRIESDGSRTKLSVGEQQVMSVERLGNGKLALAVIPRSKRDALLQGYFQPHY